MKDKFKEYYLYPDEVINDIWDKGTFVFDTNVLLNLYRYSSETRTIFLDALKYYQNRVWMPYQVGWEYHRRRESTIKDARTLAEDFIKSMEVKFSKFLDDLKLASFIKNPYIQAETLGVSVKKIRDNHKKRIEKAFIDQPDFLKEDTIRNELDGIFADRCGDNFAQEKLDKIYDQGKKRYKNHIPPGFGDANTKSENEPQSLYGDLIIWFQTIAYAKKEHKDIILVTDDTQKDDWFYSMKGNDKPRAELVGEFAEKTSQRIWIYNANNFLDKAAEDKAIRLKKDTIEEVKQTKLISKIDWSAINGMSLLPLNSGSTIGFGVPDSKTGFFVPFSGSVGQLTGVTSPLYGVNIPTESKTLEDYIKQYELKGLSDFLNPFDEKSKHDK